MAPGLVTAIAGAAGCPLLCRLERHRGRHEWCFTAAVQRDPLQNLLQEAAPKKVSLVWTSGSSCGRSVHLNQSVRRGEKLFEVTAMALVLGGSDNQQAALAAAEAPRCSIPLLLNKDLGFDSATTALCMALVQQEDAPAICSALLSHAHEMGFTPSTLQQLARQIRDAMPASADFRQLDRFDDHALAEAFLSCRSNLHRVMDDETASRAVGAGLFPAACLLNHSCVPSCSLYWSDAGNTLHARAMRDLAQGAEV